MRTERLWSGRNSERKNAPISDRLSSEPRGSFPRRVRIENNLEAPLTVEKCFEVFDERLKAFVEEKQREAQTKIITPKRLASVGTFCSFPRTNGNVGYGKTDKWRKTDFRKYFNNFDEIRFPSQMKKRKKERRKRMKK
jgi:hypothetical protein